MDFGRKFYFSAAYPKGGGGEGFKKSRNGAKID